ncbi:MAG: 30S ribosome-binding factor RbfA [Rhodospirillales bacterium]
MSKSHSRLPTREASQRQLRVGEEVRHALAQAFERGELRDPRLAGINLTVTEVSVSPDLKNALVYVVPLGTRGGEAEAQPIVDSLEHARSFLRSFVGKMVRLRHVPQLRFAFDTSFDQADAIDRLLHQPAVARDLEPHFPDQFDPELDEDDDS